MISKYLCQIIALSVLAVALQACQSSPTVLNDGSLSSTSSNSIKAIDDTAIQSTKAPVSSPENTELHSITLPHDEGELPAGPGKQIFMSRCGVCHSLRYVTMQPNFNEKTWRKELDKMRKTFGAHYTDQEEKEILTYLMQIRGKKE